ncbi:histone H3.v1 isoform X2 [Hermetia illucens]|uniref:histone H3.v1 isoform X2 n=1 Tax=Hermetia illucens TaxID=343691 RepID=UPI0018CC2AA8|nr:histone H3.v1 isoform X2 [Hermetia illucens]
MGSRRLLRCERLHLRTNQMLLLQLRKHSSLIGAGVRTIRPITSTTARQPIPYTTTPLPDILSSTLASVLARRNNVEDAPLAKSASVETANALDEASNNEDQPEEEQAAKDEEEVPVSDEEPVEEHEQEEEVVESEEEEEARSLHAENDKEVEVVQTIDESPEGPAVKAKAAEDQPSVEQRLKQISEQIEKLGSGENNDGDLGHQSFLSLSDLIKTLRPNDKKGPQIDSDYSNTMRVLGEKSSIVSSGSDESRKLKETSAEANRALF